MILCELLYHIFCSETRNLFFFLCYQAILYEYYEEHKLSNKRVRDV